MYEEQRIRSLIHRLNNENDRESSLDIAINLANALLNTLGAPEDSLKDPNKALEEAYPFSYFQNQKMETWFEKHRFYDDARTAFKLFDDEKFVYESSFYWMNESSTKGRIAATSLLGSNWEDSELTMKPEYKIGIDFYLNHNANSLLMVISKKGNVRVLEFSDRYTHTQKEILESLVNVFNMPGIDVDDPYEPQRSIHNKLWSTLQISSVNKKFYSGIAELFEELSTYLGSKYKNKEKKDIQLFSSRLLGRLLFVWFLRKKQIIDETHGYFEYEGQTSSQYYDYKLKVLFFDTLNNQIKDRTHKDKKTPFLNGGLFEVHHNDYYDDYIEFPHEYFSRLYDHLNSFNFTVDESTAEYEQIAIDPEMLGRVFENLLASIVPETSSAANERKNKGAFYTPREIVSYMCKESLKEHIKSELEDESLYDGVDKLIDINDAKFIELKSTGGTKLWGVRSIEVQKKIINIINGAKIFDPACGSGAFPMGMLQLISQTYYRLTAKYDEKSKTHVYASGKSNYNKYQSKLSIIKNNLYGSDIEPMAIEIARLRSWLSLIIEEKTEVHALPNLDFNFVCSNTLIKLNDELVLDLGGENKIFEDQFNQLRDIYFDTHLKKDKQLLKNDFQGLFDTYTRNSFTSKRVQQLKTWNPFDINIPSEFFDSKVMFDIEKFDIVIANPPYVGSGARGMEKMKKEIDNYYRKEYPNSAEYKINLYPLFLELAYNQVKSNGIVNYILPDSYLVGMYFSKLRKLLVKNSKIDIINILNGKIFNAVVGFSTIILFKKRNPVETDKIRFLRPINSSLSLMNEFKVDQLFYSKINLNKLISFSSKFDLDIYNKIHRSKKNIKNYSTCRTGIRSKIGQKKILSKEKITKTHKRGLISGSQVKKYSINYLNDWINVDDSILNSGGYDYDVINNPKILIRQTGDSLICAIDNQNYYHLNNLHSLSMDKQFELVNLEVLTAYLNSSLFNFVYQMISNEKNRVMAQTRIEVIENLPIIEPNKIYYDKLNKIVSSLTNTNSLTPKIVGLIDDIVFDIYNITLEEQKYILRKLNE